MQMLSLLIGYKYSPFCKRTLAKSKQYGASFIPQEAAVVQDAMGGHQKWGRSKLDTKGRAKDTRTPKDKSRLWTGDKPRCGSWNHTEASRRESRSVVDRLQVELKWHLPTSVVQGHVVPERQAWLT